MAENTGGKGGTGGYGGEGPGGPNLMTPSVQAQTTALKTNAEALAQNKGLLENVSLAEDEAAQKTKKFSDALKEQALKTTQALSLTNQLTGALSGYMAKLTQATSLGQHYKRMLDEVDEAQTKYIGSVNFSTKSMGDASRQMQRHITVLREMKNDATDLSKKYKVSVEEIDKVNKEVMGKFSAQIMAVAGSQKRLKEISETVFVTARTAGMEYNEVMDVMAKRGAASDKTVTQLSNDMKALAVVVDNYKTRLETLNVSKERTLLTSKQLVTTLADLQTKFEHGAPNLRVFGNLMGEFAANMHKAGLSQQIVQKNLLAMNKVFGDMSRPDLSDFFGTTAALEVARTGGEGVIQSAKTKKELQERMAEAEAAGLGEIQKARIAGEVAQKDIGYQRELAKKLMQVEGPVKHEMLLKMGGGTATGALKMEKEMTRLANMTDEELKAEEEKKKDGKSMFEKFKDIQKAVQEGSTPQEKSYRAVVDIRQKAEAIERFLKTSMIGALIAAGGSLAAQILYLRAINNSIKGLQGGLGPGGGGPDGGGVPGGRRTTTTRPTTRRGRAFSAIKRTASRAGDFVRRRPGTTMAIGLGASYLAPKLIGRDLSEGEQSAAALGPAGVMAGSSFYSRATERAAKAAQTAKPAWQVRQAEQVKKALELQKRIQETNATIVQAQRASTVTKAPGFMARVGQRLAPAGRIAGKVGGVVGRVAGVAGKALGPIGVAVSALSAVPDLIKRWKESDTIGGKAKAVGHFALEATGAKFVYRTGLQLGDFLDKKTRFITDSVTKNLGKATGKLAVSIRDRMVKDKKVSDILDDVATVPEELSEMARKAMEGFGSVERKGLLGRAKQIKEDLEKKDTDGKDKPKTMDELISSWDKQLDKQLRGGAMPIYDVVDQMTEAAKKERESLMTGAMKAGQSEQKLLIEPGAGEGETDSEFKSDPTTGDIRMKMPGSWITIRKEEFKNSVSGVVTEALTKGT